MYMNPVEAYSSVSKAAMSGREIEADILTRAALQLKNCQNNWNIDGRDEKLDAALKFNQRVWTIFQGELAREDNPLPEKVRLDLIRLSAFIDRRIFEIMSFPSPEQLTSVININQNIAAGLRGAAS